MSQYTFLKNSNKFIGLLLGISFLEPYIVFVNNSMKYFFFDFSIFSQTDGFNAKFSQFIIINNEIRSVRNSSLDPLSVLKNDI